MIFVCHRTISMAAVYQLKIKYHQDKFRVVLRHKMPVSFPLEDKHVVNEHQAVRRNHDATQKKCPHMQYFK